MASNVLVLCTKGAKSEAEILVHAQKYHPKQPFALKMRMLDDKNGSFCYKMQHSKYKACWSDSDLTI